MGVLDLAGGSAAGGRSGAAQKTVTIQVPSESATVSSYRVFSGSCSGTSPVTISYPSTGAYGPASTPCGNQTFSVGINLFGADGARQISFAQDGAPSVRGVTYRQGGLNFGSGIDGSVLAFARDAARNQIYIAGDFSQYAQYPTARNLIRINADGSLDSSFLKSGEGFNGPVRSLALDASTGTLYVGGDFTTLTKGANTFTQYRLTKLAVDGTPDLTFVPNSGSAGVLGAGSSVRALLYNSGTLYFGGFFNGYTDPVGNSTGWSNFGAVNPTGAAQTTFLAAGMGVSGTVNALAADGNGNIYVGGTFTNIKGTPRSNFARLNSSGVVDTAFSTAGVTGSVNALVVDPVNQKLFVGGLFTGVSGTNVSNITAIDISIGSGPVNTTWSSQFAGVNNTVTGLSFDSTNNRLYLSGAFNAVNYGTGGISHTYPNYVLRINSTHATPQPDSTWVANGYGFDAPTNAILFDPSTVFPQIYVGGSFSNYSNSASNTAIRNLARLVSTSNAQADTAFQGSASGAPGNIYAIAVDPVSGKTYLGGGFNSINTGNGSVSQNYLTRLNADGTVDTTFLGSGDGFNGAVSALALDTANAKLYVGGSFTSYTHGSIIAQKYLTRLNLDGTVDTTFVPTGTGFNGAVKALAVDSASSRIYVGGLFTSYTNGTATTQNYITRLTSSGTVDPTFNPASGGFNAAVLALTLDPATSKLYVGGNFTQYSNGSTTNQYFVSRLFTSGGVDTSFMAATDTMSGTGVNALVWDPATSRLFVGGTFGSITKGAVTTLTQSNLMSLKADGTVDQSLVANGNGFNNSVYALTLKSGPGGASTLLVGGSFTGYITVGGGQSLNGIAQISLSDGSLTGFVPPQYKGFNSSAIVSSLATAPNGDILVGGNFGSYNGTLIGSNFARLLSDGSLAPN